MKKLVLLTLILSLILTAIPAFAQDVTVELDGVVIDCTDAHGNYVPPIIVNNSTYLPVRAIATALDLDVQWDDATKTVFINGVSVLAKKTDVINIFINGGKFIAKDANGNVINPILQNSTTYLPVRAIGEAFDKKVEWIAETKTVKLTTVVPEITATIIDANKTYAFINKATGKALTATDHYTLVSEAFNESAAQGFKFVPSDIDGYYFIQSISNGQNFDVSGHSVSPGGEIITYSSTGADNQKFAIKDVEGGAIVYSFASGLPIEPAADNTIQNTNNGENDQKWEIKAFDAPEVVLPADGPYRVFTQGSSALTDTDSLKVDATANSASQKWSLVDVGGGEVVITNLATGKSLDVSGQSLNAGDPIITWFTNSDVNQRWILEDAGNNTYYIKSVHSGLYLTINGNTLIQTYKNSNEAQLWTMTKSN